MPTLIRKLKRIATPATKPSESSPVGAAAPTQNDLAALVHHDSQLRKTEAAATGVTDMNKSSSSNPSDNATSPQKASAADTSADTTASISSNKRNTHSDRTRKSSSVDEELAREKRARSNKKYRYECSAEGCTNQVLNGGVCMRHGAKVKRCSNVGCTKYAHRGGVCMKHGAKVKLCSADVTTHDDRKRKSSSADEELAREKSARGVCMKHGAKISLCSSEGCTNPAANEVVCIRHGAKVKVKRYSYDGTFQAHRPTHPLPPTNFTIWPPLGVYPNHMMPPHNHNYHGYPPPVHHGNATSSDQHCHIHILSQECPYMLPFYSAKRCHLTK